MISLDTNVIISTLESADSRHAEALAALIREQHQGYVISPAVYSELRAGPDWSRYQNWLSLTRVPVMWSMPQEVWELAGVRHGQYAQLRRSGNMPRRILPDFLIAAHAEYHGLDVMGFDRTVYDSVFTGLNLVDPMKILSLTLRECGLGLDGSSDGGELQDHQFSVDIGERRLLQNLWILESEGMCGFAPFPANQVCQTQVSVGQRLLV